MEDNTGKPASPPTVSYNEFLEGVYRGEYNAHNPKLKEDALRLKRARNAWGEGRNQGADGMHLINQVVDNRANSKGKWGWSTDPYDVMTPAQFSAWRPVDENYPKMMAQHKGSKDPQFQEAYRVVNEEFPEHLKKYKDVDHYYAPAAVVNVPKWKSDPRMTHLGDHGGHKLYTSKPQPKPKPGLVTGKPKGKP